MTLFCVKCGVELADSEISCPLCGTKVVLPSGLSREVKPSPFPPFPGQVHDGMTHAGIMLLVSSIFFISALICFCCDMRINGGIIWSGYVMLSLALFYIIAVFPKIFPQKVNPIITVPIDFAAILGFLLYVNFKTDGNWFLSFAFPVVGMLGILASAVTVLHIALPKHRLFIYGTSITLLGCMSMLIELFAVITFGGSMFSWCFYPLTVLCTVGILLIIIGFCPSMKEGLKKKLFF